MIKDFGIYIHIPFCRQKCFYCDFPSFAGKEGMIEPYLEALEQEIGQVRQKLSDRGEAVFGNDSKLAPKTLYIGGGTPTVLETVALPDVFYLLQKHIDVERVAEFTIEANPGTVDGEKLRLLRSFGINRLSLGVQSFDDGCLKAIGRIHSGQEAAEAVAEADLFVIVGTSLNVYPAAGLLNYVAPGTPVYVIDPDRVAVHIRRDITYIEKGASEGMRDLCSILLPNNP